MNDIRIRTFTSAILSFMAFISVIGALFAILWWLVFTRRFAAVPKRSFVIGSLAFIAIIAILLELLQGQGLSYGIRMAAIMLVAAWLWSEYQPGEMLDLCVWALGNRYGFDLGLVAELSLQSFASLLADLDRMRMAWRIKGIALTPSRLPAAGVFLTRNALTRARDTGELLAARGYCGGGSLCPAFRPTYADALGAAAAATACTAALVVGEFFILLN